ncbi:MAG: DNA alkylation repair protein [Alphaproteobacteria bacterium]|jgi:3-methyladenine DNA glycosylase AlkD|nr:DNA alkylation repair protein [Alphaproteobacteria bacterium]
MSAFSDVRAALDALISATSPEVALRFFKTGPGEYASHDQFHGLSVPNVRALAKKYAPALTREEVLTFLSSPFNEERLLGIFFLIFQYEKAAPAQQDELYAFSLTQMPQINNWNLVDLYAPKLMGMHLLARDRSILDHFVKSAIMWERRIAVVSTLTFIRAHDLQPTLRLCQTLMSDKEDLMHKACGWMLREVGKKDEGLLRTFLNAHKGHMPRTMLRYAIERFSPEERAAFLKK